MPSLCWLFLLLCWFYAFGRVLPALQQGWVGESLAQGDAPSLGDLATPLLHSSMAQLNKLML